MFLIFIDYSYSNSVELFKHIFGWIVLIADLLQARFVVTYNSMVFVWKFIMEKIGNFSCWHSVLLTLYSKSNSLFLCHLSPRYLYITVLRDPVERFLSEWKHVKRGGTWRTALLMCNHKSATLDEVPFCFKGLCSCVWHTNLPVATKVIVQGICRQTTQS